MLNRATIVGRLTDDVKLQTTHNGKYVVKFSVAVNRIGDGVDYINCEAWNKTAEFLGKYAKKGNRVAVDGRIRTGDYEDKNTGRKVYFTNIVAEYVDLLETRSESSEQKSGTNSYYNDVADDDFNTGPLLDISSDDLPF